MTTGFCLKLDEDWSGLRRMEKSLRELQHRHIRWGWLSNINHPTKDGKRGEYSVAQIANFQEYGTDKIPARPYFRQALILNRHKYNTKDIAEIYRSALTGLVDHVKLNALAEELVKDYHESVLRQNFKKLSEYTIELKGHSYQMDDTGLMLTSFEAKVYKQKQDAIRD